MVRPNGTELCRVVATSTSFAAGVAWSPAPAADGAYKIVYVDGTNSTGGRRLFAVSAVCGATDSHALTQTAGQWAYPAWSEGGRLAVTFYPDTYVFDVRDTNGTITLENPVNLTSEGPLAGYEEGQPSWTPDGTELLVGAGPIGPWLDEDLWVISADTPGIATQLTHTPESIEFRVTWSPDRTTIAFGDTRDLYTAAISQPWTVGTPALLLDSRYNVRSPSWRPVP
jgi:Tol biopolymer transport system component